MKQLHGFQPLRFKYGKKVAGILVAASEELRDCPLFYSLPTLCKTLHCTCPPLPQILAAIENAGKLDARTQAQHSLPGRAAGDDASAALATFSAR